VSREADDEKLRCSTVNLVNLATRLTGVTDGSRLEAPPVRE
jgi:hypothetical protein